MLMYDICCGLKGASKTMLERGWRVVTIDNDPAFDADIVADVRDWHPVGLSPDLIWASPPCYEFARENMPWCRTGESPDLSIVEACWRIIREANPRYWIIENVRGAMPYLGQPAFIYGAFYLWGFFPVLGNIIKDYRKKESYGSQQKAERARIPSRLSLAVARAIESSRVLI